MSLKIRDILRIYRKLGGSAEFRVKLREGRDTVAEIFCEGKLVIFTRISHGKGALEGKLIHKIRNQFRLSEDEFRDIIRCTLSAEDYKEILKAKGCVQ